MSLPVFLWSCGELPARGTEVEFTGPEARHAVTVKRLAIGEQFLLIDGRGTGVIATVTAVDAKDKLRVSVGEGVDKRARKPRVTVVQAIPKSERAELAVDLATQGGADRIVPWQAERCIAKWGGKAEKAVAKWRNQALAAAKQSRRFSVPEVTELATSAEVAELIRGGDGVAVLLHEEASVPFASLNYRAAAEVVLVIGPEGGLSPDEVARFTEAGAQAVRLGPEVLRTASAALVALSALGVLTDRW
ncbi:16S rRNA (uracil(1498)-N(3))-methyltransferase [Corynebacterium canis]|uniref:Ribosomal RNA small subunit methyltransferase E n=1 Tax=Corynebacterium canis TaxID=679663 RepID=A0A5C5USH9_9CORY|nr:16S rRNA (uracil(1498)-N(3))-methyltransferase [Corynebacterium canis]TWT28530.1 16S rRNA (uracil(1498)-N(3))-methyltransferase [Corynebacterium canis]WJY75881.1 Ribosomal RNA small subunit methyltransferase E [Corynebacterium canis]